MTLAIPAAALAIPVKPNTAETSETPKNINTHVNISALLFLKMHLFSIYLLQLKMQYCYYQFSPVCNITCCSRSSKFHKFLSIN